MNALELFPQDEPVKFSVTFVGMVPDEELTGIVRTYATRGMGAAVSARIERRGQAKRYSVVVQRGDAEQTSEARDPRTALCHAFDRLESSRW